MMACGAPLSQRAARRGRRIGGSASRAGTRLVRRLVHGRHARTVVLAREAANVRVHFDGSDRRRKVVKPVAWARVDAEPIGEVVRIRERGREAQHATRARLPKLFRDVSSARHDDLRAERRRVPFHGVHRGGRRAGGARLEHGASLLSEKMDLVDDEQAYVCHVLTPPPASRDSVPFLWRCDDHVRALERSGVGRHIPSELKDRQRRVADKFGAPIMQPLACKRLKRRGCATRDARARARGGGGGIARARASP